MWDMQEIIVIVGLPGSGKSTYIEQNFEGVFVCDDYHKSGGGSFETSVYYKDLVRTLAQGNNAVISDIAYCKDELLEETASGLLTLIGRLKINPRIKYLYFENDPDACKENIMRRKREGRVERELAFVDETSSRYTVPHKATVLPVFRPESARHGDDSSQNRSHNL